MIMPRTSVLPDGVPTHVNVEFPTAEVAFPVAVPLITPEKEETVDRTPLTIVVKPEDVAEVPEAVVASAGTEPDVPVVTGSVAARWTREDKFHRRSGRFIGRKTSNMTCVFSAPLC